MIELTQEEYDLLTTIIRIYANILSEHLNSGYYQDGLESARITLFYLVEKLEKAIGKELDYYC